MNSTIYFYLFSFNFQFHIILPYPEENLGNTCTVHTQAHTKKQHTLEMLHSVCWYVKHLFSSVRPTLYSTGEPGLPVVRSVREWIQTSGESTVEKSYLACAFSVLCAFAEQFLVPVISRLLRIRLWMLLLIFLD